jgi:hypothetical protein
MEASELGVTGVFMALYSRGDLGNAKIAFRWHNGPAAAANNNDNASVTALVASSGGIVSAAGIRLYRGLRANTAPSKCTRERCSFMRALPAEYNEEGNTMN